MGLYKGVVPPLIKSLKNLSGLLQKAAKFADDKGMKHEDILTFRLHPEMRGLTYQVQSCSNTAKFLPYRLGAIDDVFFADDEETFEQLQARITSTIELLHGVDENAIDKSENEPVIMKTKSMGDFKFESGQKYATEYAIPNFHFHLSSAYCILRHLGVPIGAMDYLGADTFVKV